MCDPVSAILAAVGTGVSMAGQVVAGRAANKQAKQQAALLKGNAELAATAGFSSELRVRQNVGRIEADQTATYSANGIDPGFGSPAYVQALTAMQGEQDAQVERSAGLTRRADFLNQASGVLTRASDQQNAGALGLVSTFIDGAQSVWKGLKGDGGGGGGKAGVSSSSSFNLSQPFASTWHR